MSEGVIVTVTFPIKPDCAERFVEALSGMFPVTRTRDGFRNIRLLKSQTEPNHFVLIEEWDAAQNFYDYAQFRVETGDTAMLMDMTSAPPQMGLYDLKPLAAA
jgi:quinol monooxygenase YgiN